MEKKQEILVTVICLAYQHGSYIRQTLEGFVCQKTDFPFEVIVHDDASTDGTADIIREFARKYPDLIRPVIQKENQHNKGLNYYKEFILPLARGRYYAFCEGDDYWCEDTKLQKQVCILQSHPECPVCVHNTTVLRMDDNQSYVPYEKQDKLLSLSDVILRGGQSFHTSSVMVRSEVFRCRPDFCFSIKGVSDYPNAIYYAMTGPIYYLGDVMSVYRLGVPGSWSKRSVLSRQRLSATGQQTDNMLRMADAYSGKRYHGLFEEARIPYTFQGKFFSRDFRGLLRKKYVSEINKLPFHHRILVIFGQIPGFVKILDLFDKVHHGKK